MEGVKSNEKNIKAIMTTKKSCMKCFYKHINKHFKLSNGSKHITRNQKRCWLLNIINQNQEFIYLLPYKIIIIMAS